MKTTVNGKPNELRVPPHATDLEESILGVILLERDSIITVSSLLSAHNFYSDRHQLIYTAMLDLDRSQQPIDILTVARHLERLGTLEQAGGAYYLTTLTNSVVSNANLEAWSRIVIQMWMLREMIRIAQKTLNQCFSRNQDSFDIMDEMGEGLNFIQAHLDGTKTTNYSELVFKRVAAIKANDGTIPTGIQTGFRSLDRMLLGFFPQLYIIAARPSMGKTGWLIALLENISKGVYGRPGVPVGFFELETPAPSFIDRHLANKTGLNTRVLKMGGLSAAQQDTLDIEATEIFNQPIIADFLSNINVSMMRSKIRTWIKRYGVKIIFIDYLQILAQMPQDERKTREQQVSKDVTSLASLALELHIPIVAFAQLNRQVHNRAGNRPNLSDLRESGTIEAAARAIMFLHRPEYYGEPMDEAGDRLPPGVTEIIVAKNNEGETGTVKLIFKKEQSKFIEYEEPDSKGDNWEAMNIQGF